MRQLIFGFAFTTCLAAFQAAALADFGHGLFHHRHSACQKCDETVVIHCYPQGAPHHRRHAAQTAQPAAAPAAAPPTVIPYQANYGFQAGYGMGMQMMPVMPMMGGLMPAAYQGYSQAAAPQQATKECKCDDTKQRIDQLETDFKKLAGQVDEVVNSVDRNTIAIDKLVKTLVEQGKLTLPANP